MKECGVCLESRNEWMKLGCGKHEICIQCWRQMGGMDVYDGVILEGVGCTECGSPDVSALVSLNGLRRISINVCLHTKKPPKCPFCRFH
jgi:hypothetical protein